MKTVNVLEVMGEAANRLHSTCAVMGENQLTIQYLQEARAAVVELAEVAGAARTALQDHADPALRSLSRELAMALAKVNGGAA